MYHKSRLILSSEGFEFRNYICDKFKKMSIKFENLGDSDLVISVSFILVSMHIYARCEGSVISHTGGRGNCIEKEIWLKNIGHIDIIVHVLRRVCMYAKYEASVIKPVASRTVHKCHQTTTMTHDGQFMIVQALLAFMPNKLINVNKILEVVSSCEK